VIYRFENVEEGVDPQTVELLDSTIQPDAFEEVRPPELLLPKKECFFRRRLRLGDDDTEPGWFEWSMGVFLPIICFVFDPIIFKGPLGHGGFLSDYQTFAYSLSSMSILTMMAWLLLGKRVGWLAPWMAGTFFSASLVSLAIGIVMFPISVIGLIVIVGALGFSPLFFSLVYFRGGMRALRLALSQYDKGKVAHIVAFSALMSLGVPIIAQKHLGPSLKSYLNTRTAQHHFDD